MWWIAFVVLQIVVTIAGVRREQAAGLWSWSKFFFAIAFAALEWCLLMGTFVYAEKQRQHFAAIVTAGSVLAAANFVWFIIAARRWKLPDGRTSLHAYRDEKQAVRESSEPKDR